MSKANVIGKVGWMLMWGCSRLDLTAPTAYQGPRRLLKEGVVSKSKSGKKLTLVLCNDILVLIESRNLYRMVCASSPYMLGGPLADSLCSPYRCLTSP